MYRHPKLWFQELQSKKYRRQRTFACDKVSFANVDYVTMTTEFLTGQEVKYVIFS